MKFFIYFFFFYIRNFWTTYTYESKDWMWARPVFFFSLGEDKYRLSLHIYLYFVRKFY